MKKNVDVKNHPFSKKVIPCNINLGLFRFAKELIFVVSIVLIYID